MTDTTYFLWGVAVGVLLTSLVAWLTVALAERSNQKEARRSYTAAEIATADEVRRQVRAGRELKAAAEREVDAAEARAMASLAGYVVEHAPLD